MSQFSNATLNQLANALVDDAIKYILEDERYVQFFQGIISDAIKDKLGDVEDEVLMELGAYIFERISLYPHSHCNYIVYPEKEPIGLTTS